MNKPKILYVLGGGHSGSTLIDLMLGSQKQFHSLGEISFYDIYSRKQDHEKINLATEYNCSCGKDFSKCLFWSSFYKKNPSLSLKKSFSKLTSLKIALDILNPFSRKPSVSCLSDDTIFFKKLQAIVGDVTFVDSSKDPRRLYYLLQNKDLEVKVLYMVRDGRAYANSYNKKIRSEIGLKRRFYLISIFEWIIINFLSVRMIKKYSLNHFKLSYDLFCQSPNSSLEELGKFLSSNLDYTTIFRDIRKTEYHTLCGNYKTFSNMKQVRYDLSWKKKNRFYHILFGPLAFLFNKTLVYSPKTKLK